jgi:hypothetical protein
VEKVIAAVVGGILTLAFVAYAAKVGQGLFTERRQACTKSESESSREEREAHLWGDHETPRQASVYGLTEDPSSANLLGG